MATMTICDVKVCGKIINHSKDQHGVQLAGKQHMFCIKCYNDLMQFIKDNLLEGVASDVGFKITTNPYIGQPVYITTPAPTITLPYIHPPSLMPNGEITWYKNTSSFTLAKNEVQIDPTKISETIAGYINAKT